MLLMDRLLIRRRSGMRNLGTASALGGVWQRDCRIGLTIGADRDVLDMTDELPRAHFPGAAQREGATRVAGNSQRLETGDAQVFVQNADRVAADDILRPGDRKSGDGNAAGERFELHDAERVGAAREYEHVCRREMRGQSDVFQQAEELRVGKAPLERRL